MATIAQSLWVSQPCPLPFTLSNIGIGGRGRALRHIYYTWVGGGPLQFYRRIELSYRPTSARTMCGIPGPTIIRD